MHLMSETIIHAALMWFFFFPLSAPICSTVAVHAAPPIKRFYWRIHSQYFLFTPTDLKVCVCISSSFDCIASFFFGSIFIWILLTNKLAPLGIHTNSWRVGYRGVLWVLARSAVICVCECEFTLLIVAWTNESRYGHMGVRIGKLKLQIVVQGSHCGRPSFFLMWAELLSQSLVRKYLEKK